MENNNEQRPWFFNLNHDGDSAIVRLLHSNPKTIEAVDTHTIEVGGKKKRIKCNGSDCLLCADNNEPSRRIYVHLWDYSDNQEKVWDRTDKILPQLESLFETWGPLNTAVVKITRVGNEFPKYTIATLNPTQFAEPAKELIDKQIAVRYSMKRSNDEIKTFLETGSFPERKPFIPKDEYFKQKDAAKQSTQNSGPFDNLAIQAPRKV